MSYDLNRLETQDFLLFFYDVLLAWSYTEITAMLFLFVQDGQCVAVSVWPCFHHAGQTRWGQSHTFVCFLWCLKVQHNWHMVWPGLHHAGQTRWGQSVTHFCFLRCLKVHHSWYIPNIPYAFSHLSYCPALVDWKKTWTRMSAFDTIGSICFVVRVVLTLHGTSLQFIPEGGKIQVTLGNEETLSGCLHEYSQDYIHRYIYIPLISLNDLTKRTTPKICRMCFCPNK